MQVEPDGGGGGGRPILNFLSFHTFYSLAYHSSRLNRQSCFSLVIEILVTSHFARDEGEPIRQV